MYEMRTRLRIQFMLWAFLVVALGFGNLAKNAEADPSLNARGEKVYADKKCAACHMIGEKGGKVGGDLSQVGAKRDQQWLRTFLNNPKTLIPKAIIMPPFKGTDEELGALIDYLASLK